MIKPQRPQRAQIQKKREMNNSDANGFDLTLIPPDADRPLHKISRILISPMLQQNRSTLAVAR